MYKDVAKRILAFMMMVCMFVTLTEWPVPVWAAGTGNHTHFNGDGATAEGTLDAGTMAAVFKTDGAEQIGDVSFDVHVEDGVNATATVSVYVNIKDGQPESGERVFMEQRSVAEGTTSCSVNQIADAGTSFSVVVSLEGASFYTFGCTGEGQSYVKSGGTWQDIYKTSRRCAAIRASYNNVRAMGSSTSSSAGAVTYAADTPAVADANVDISKDDIAFAVGESARIYLLNVPEGETVYWNMADETIARIPDGNGPGIYEIWPRGINEGTTTVTATYGEKEYVCIITVTGNITASVISLNPENADYDGEMHLPEVTVKVGGVVLTEGEHYSLSYQKYNPDAVGNTDEELWPTVMVGENNAFINAGRYRVNVIGNGLNGYSNSKSVEYVIREKSITDPSIEVDFIGEHEDWDTVLGGADPELTLKDRIEIRDEKRNGEQLVYGQDYTLSVNDAKDAVIITGIGNYTDVREKTTPEKLTGNNAQIVWSLPGEIIYSGKEQTPSYSVLYNGVTLSADDFTPTWSGNRTNVSDTDNKLTVKGKGDYFGEISATFSILPKNILNKDSAVTKVTWNLATVPKRSDGGAINADYVNNYLTITHQGMAMVKDTDYKLTVTQSGEADSNTYTLTIEGINNFYEKDSTTFTVGEDINEYIDDVAFVNGAVYTYNGSEIRPEVTVSMKSGVTLQEGQDYIIDYVNNIDVPAAGSAETPKVIVKGYGNYGGTIERAFTINPLNITSDLNVAVSLLDKNGNQAAPGALQLDYSPEADEMKPGVSAIYQGRTLEEGKDYSTTATIDAVDTTASVVIGQQSVTVTGKGNFVGSRTLSYTVNALSLSSSRIKVYAGESNYDYTGREVVLPEPTLTYEGSSGSLYRLTKDTDYTIEKSQTTAWKEPGSYWIRFNGKGNYKESVQKDITITAIDIQTIVDKTHVTITNADRITAYDGPYYGMLWFTSQLIGTSPKNEAVLEIKGADGTTLTEHQDYELRYEGLDIFPHAGMLRP